MEFKALETSKVVIQNKTPIFLHVIQNLQTTVILIPDLSKTNLFNLDEILRNFCLEHYLWISAVLEHYTKHVQFLSFIKALFYACQSYTNECTKSAIEQQPTDCSTTNRLFTGRTLFARRVFDKFTGSNTTNEELCCTHGLFILSRFRLC